VNCKGRRVFGRWLSEEVSLLEELKELMETDWFSGQWKVKFVWCSRVVTDWLMVIKWSV